MGDTDDGFLSRWSRRKVQARDGETQTESPTAPTASTASTTTLPAAQATATAGAAPASPAQDTARPPPTTAPAEGAAAGPAAAAPPAPPQPTMDDVARLTQDSDYSRFVGRGVDPGVKNAALHKLFTDPHFNVMDGLDTYIDDYGLPDPLPPGMLEKMVQSEALGLFTKTPEDKTQADAAPAPLGPEPPSERGATADLDASAAAERSNTPPDISSDTASGESSDTPADPPRPLSEARAHEDPDLRLQPHDAAGTAEPPGPGGHGAAGPGQDPGRQR